jgi:predicted transport protein
MVVCERTTVARNTRLLVAGTSSALIMVNVSSGGCCGQGDLRLSSQLIEQRPDTVGLIQRTLAR